MKEKYVAFLRGINVGGHHKVPMADLRIEMEKLHFEQVTTLLNSGNIVFESTTIPIEDLELKITRHLEKSFGFSIPTIIRPVDIIHELFKTQPFKDIEMNKNMRFYVSFLRREPKNTLEIPWQSDDGSYKVLSMQNKTIISVLDLSLSKTPKAMEVIERTFGKDVTTRNWNTLIRIVNKINTN